MAGGAEDAFEFIGGGAGTDRKTKAGNAVRAELLQGLTRVGLRVTAFVTLVVGKAIGKHNQQPIRCAGLGLKDFAGATDGGTQARITRWLELIEPCSPDG